MRHATVQEEGTQHPLIAAALGNHHSAAPDNDLDQRQFQATYWGMLGEVDDQFGSLLATIERAGATGDTLVILTSDHGEQLGDHWLRQKLGFFDQSYHVPLIAAGPGVTAPGHVVDDFTESIDLMPTILAAVGAGVPSARDDRSSRSSADGGPTPGATPCTGSGTSATGWPEHRATSSVPPTWR